MTLSLVVIPELLLGEAEIGVIGPERGVPLAQ